MNFNNTFESSFGALEFIRPYWLLGIIAVFIFAFWRYTQHSNKQTKIIASHLSEHLLTLPETTNTKRFALNLLAIIAFFALSGPSIRSVQSPVYEKQQAQVIAFDLSYSMYATDIKPNRLSRAKYKAMDLLKQWTEGDKALIAYAGDAFTITPLTKDSNAIINHVPNLSPDLMPVRGSRPDLALNKAISLLTNAGYQQGHIVFITDGFDQTSLKAMQQSLQDTNWMVSVLAMATDQGAPIQLQDGSLLKNNNGNIVIPKLEKDKLYPVAQLSSGLYLPFDATGQDITKLVKHYTNDNTFKKNDNAAVNTENKQLLDDGYWLSFLLIPLFMLLFRKGVFYIALFSLMLPLTTPKVEASIWENDQQNAYQAFQNGDYKTASENFEDLNWKGSALFKDKKYKQAESVYLQQQKEQPNNAQTVYNLGNAQAMQEKYQQALASYNAALKLKPDFKQAQRNKEQVEKILNQQQQKKNQDQKNNDKNDQSSSDQQEQQEQSSQQQQEQSSQQQQEQSSQQQQEQSSQQQQEQNSQQQQEQNSQQQQEQNSQQQQEQNSQQQQEQNSQQQQEQNSQQQQEQNSQQQQEQSSQQQQEQNNQQQQEQNSQQQQEEESQQQAEQAQSEQQENTEQQEEQLEYQSQQITESLDETNQEYEELPNWLKNMPDDPALLLRNKMQLEYRKRAANKPVLQKNNGEIW